MTETELETKRPLLLRRLPGLALTVFADMVGLYTSVLLLLWLLTGEQIWFVNLFVNAVPGMLYPVPIALVIALLLRKRRTLVLMVLPVLALIVLYGGYVLPKSSLPAGDGREITIMTYNTLFFNKNHEATIQVIQEANADIVTLQEVEADTNAALQAQLSDDYPYWIWHLEGGRFEGRLTISRYPVVEEEPVTGAVRDILYHRVTIDVEGTRVTVYNTHTPRPSFSGSFDTSARSDDLDVMVSRLFPDSALSLSPHSIVLGDFNMSDQTQDYRRFASYLTDAYRVAGNGLGTTFENFSMIPGLGWMPGWVRLDYVFVSDDITPLEAHVIRAGTSDHYPLWARLTLNPE